LLMFFRLIDAFIDSIQYGFNVIRFDWVIFKTVWMLELVTLHIINNVTFVVNLVLNYWTWRIF
jgi:hypothetical protein